MYVETARDKLAEEGAILGIIFLVPVPLPYPFPKYSKRYALLLSTPSFWL